MIKAVIFDLDDTLYDESSYVSQAFDQVATYLSQKYGISKQEIFEKMKYELDCHGRGKIFDRVCEYFSLQESIKDLVHIYRNTVPDLNLYPDSEDILNKLKRTGIRTGIITDGCSVVQHKKLDALGLKKIIDYIIVTDDFGPDYWKPSRKPYLDMLKTLGCEPGQSIYVGDNPHKDFLGAKAIGMKTVRIKRQKGMFIHTDLSKEYEANKTITNLLVLEELLS